MWACSTAALACALAPASAAAATSSPSDGDLSPRLAELAKPSVRSAPPAAQARALSVPAAGPGSLLREGNRVLVDVRFDRGAAGGVDDLRAAGAEIVNVSTRYQTVTVAAKPSELRKLSTVPRVAAATEVLTPIAASTCPSGVAVSEGDAQLRAAEARTAFGVDGSGVTVGILSDSFDHATEAADESGPVATHEAEDVATGDLPGSGNTCGQETPVDKLDDSDVKGEDEGRAMGQIVHDLAPGANLAFATAFASEIAFAENVEKLAKPPGEGGAGAKVIADDVAYPEEPFFQEGPVGVAVSKVTGEGVSYFSSAANNNLIADGKDIASWEAPEYRDSSGCPAGVVAFSESFEGGLNPTHCMDFNPGPGVDRTFRITVSKGATLRLDLQWAEPWEGVATDLDAFLLGPGGGLLRSSIDANVTATQRPFEFIGWENKTGAPVNVQLAINRFSGGDPRLKFALLQNGGGVTSTEYQSSQGGDVVGPAIFGHNGAEDAISVGAIQHNATEAPESFSSRGPVTRYFGPVNGGTAAEPLPTPQVLSKPDVTATDCGATTFFAREEGGLWRFCGTSAAAPHAAAVAALMLQEEPLATPAQIRSALWESAAPIGSSGACEVGAGLIDAVGALEALLAPGAGSGPACVPPESGPVVEEGDGEPSFIEAEKEIATANPPAPELPPFTPNFDPSPTTLFRKHPPHVIRSRKSTAQVVFRFGASEADVTFACQVDRTPFRTCPQRFVQRFGAGAHVLRVVARDAAGNVDPTPAVYRFRVKRIE
ncbi:MAG TPA: S8 family serine peptidase [Solirubrobacterales bacterium]|nr:S8 family serine peptidase [Solirubrobacterales bacterium]